MCPILFRVFGTPVPAYGVAFVAAILVTVVVARRRAPRFDVAPGRTTDFIFWGAVSAFVCAKVFHAAVLLFQHGWRGFDLWPVLKGGGIFYGGVFGALAGAAVFARVHGLSFWTLGDIVFPGGVMAHAIGRLGCLMAGCCYGTPTDLPVGITFTNPVSERLYGTPLGVSLHPVQLYEAVLVVPIGAFLIFLTNRRPFPGVFFPFYLMLYAVVRFSLEFYRSDFRGDWVNGVLSTSQVLSIVAFTVGAATLALWWPREARTART